MSIFFDFHKKPTKKKRTIKKRVKRKVKKRTVKKISSNGFLSSSLNSFLGSFSLSKPRKKKKKYSQKRYVKKTIRRQGTKKYKNLLSINKMAGGGQHKDAEALAYDKSVKYRKITLHSKGNLKETTQVIKWSRADREYKNIWL